MKKSIGKYWICSTGSNTYQYFFFIRIFRYVENRSCYHAFFTIFLGEKDIFFLNAAIFSKINIFENIC